MYRMYSNSPDGEIDYFLLGKRKINDVTSSPNKKQKLDDNFTYKFDSISGNLIKINSNNESNKIFKDIGTGLAQRYMAEAKIYEEKKDFINMITSYYEVLKFSHKLGAAAKIGDYYVTSKPYIAIHYYHTERCNGDELLGCWKLINFFGYYNDEEMYERMLDACVVKFKYKPAIDKLIEFYNLKGDYTKRDYYKKMLNI